MSTLATGVVVGVTGVDAVSVSIAAVLSICMMTTVSVGDFGGNSDDHTVSRSDGVSVPSSTLRVMAGNGYGMNEGLGLVRCRSRWILNSGMARIVVCVVLDGIGI